MKKAFEPVRNPIADAPVDPPPVQPDDAQLTQSVRQALAVDGRIAGEAIAVTVVDGCVFLNGTVTKEYLRVFADACVSAVPGVLVVMNRLDVLQKGPMGKAPDQ